MHDVSSPYPSTHHAQQSSFNRTAAIQSIFSGYFNYIVIVKMYVLRTHVSATSDNINKNIDVNILHKHL